MILVIVVVKGYCKNLPGYHEECFGHGQPETVPAACLAVAVEPDLEGSEAVVHKTASGDLELSTGISVVLIEAPTEIGCIVAEVGGIVAERDQEASFLEFHRYFSL